MITSAADWNKPWAVMRALLGACGGFGRIEIRGCVYGVHCADHVRHIVTYSDDVMSKCSWDQICMLADHFGI